MNGYLFTSCQQHFFDSSKHKWCACACAERLVSVSRKRMSKTSFSLGAAVRFCALAHLGETQEAHHHSTASPPSFLTGLETRKRERERYKVSGRDCSFTFRSWHRFDRVFPVFKSLPTSPCISSPLCLCQCRTRSQCKEARGVDAGFSEAAFEPGESSEVAHTASDSLSDARCFSTGL